jgi:hypothetical protein
MAATQGTRVADAADGCDRTPLKLPNAVTKASCGSPDVKLEYCAPLNPLP